MALWNVVYKHYDYQRFSYLNERHFGFMLITYQYNHTKFEYNKFLRHFFISWYFKSLKKNQTELSKFQALYMTESQGSHF